MTKEIKSVEEKNIPNGTSDITEEKKMTESKKCHSFFRLKNGEYDLSGEEPFLDNSNKKKNTKENKQLIKEQKKQLKQDKEYQKRTRKLNLRTIAALLVLGVFTGSGLGVWYFNTNMKSRVDYTLYEVSEYKPNMDNVFNSINISSKADRENWVEIVRQNGIQSPMDIKSPINNALLALYNAQQADEFLIVSNGKVDTIAGQTVYSVKKFDGHQYSFESISTGFINIAFRDVMKVDNKNQAKNIDIYDGKNVKKTSADWVFNKTMSPRDYEDYTGGMPYTINPYIISEKTVTNKPELIYNEEKGTYSVKFELHPIYSVLTYNRQVRRTGKLDAYPYFTALSQTVTIDKDWNIVSLYVEEKYTAVKGVAAKCVGSLLSEFSFDLSENNVAAKRI